MIDDDTLARHPEDDERAREPIVDVPSPIDLRDPEDAREWAELAMVRRPFRVDFFERFSQAIAKGPQRARVLELGSGPGFLARHLLEAHPHLRYVAFDFSAPMHALARTRLGALAARVDFIERSFREDGWAEGLGTFEFVVTHQAVHELRHKAHALALHRQVRQVLVDGGRYLVSDHWAGEGGMANDQLYMTVDEQREALLAAGFTKVVPLLQLKGLILHEARP